MHEVLQATKDLFNSKTFEDFLAYLVTSINYVNAQNNKGIVQGIKLSCLKQVCNKKTFIILLLPFLCILTKNTLF